MKHILIAFQRTAISRETVDRLGQILSSEGFMAVMLSVRSQSRPIEVYGLDNLTQLELEEVRNMCKVGK